MKRLLLLSVLILTGCASHQPGVAGATAQKVSCEHGECMVCKKNADLACVDVAIDDKTPRYDYAGKTYYFCSEECRGKFAKNPQKYLH
jgi:hypothetical protein